MSEGTSAVAPNALRGLRHEELLWLGGLAVLLAGGLWAGSAEPYEWVTRRSSSSIAPLPGMLAAVVGATAALRVGSWRAEAGEGERAGASSLPRPFRWGPVRR